MEYSFCCFCDEFIKERKAVVDLSFLGKLDALVEGIQEFMKLK